MPIIDNAQAAQATPQAMPPGQPEPQQQVPQGQQGQKGPSEPVKDVLIAVYGMLYDKRVAVGEKLGQQIKSSRDPVAIIANSAHDLVASAIEKTGIQIPPDEFRECTMLVLGRVMEIAQAVGFEPTPEIAAEIGQMLMERVGGGEEPGEAAEAGEGPGQEEPGEDPNQPDDD